MKKVRVWIAKDEGSDVATAFMERPTALTSGRKVFIGLGFQAGLTHLKRMDRAVGIKPGDCREFFLVPVAKGGKGGRHG